MMGWYSNNWDWGAWMLLMMLGWLALIGLGLWAVVALTRAPRGYGAGPTAREILDRRLAAGGIGREEYLAVRAMFADTDADADADAATRARPTDASPAAGARP